MADNHSLDSRLDNELAELTDRLIAGRDMEPPQNLPDLPELEALANVTRQLHRLMSQESAPSPAFRSRLTQRLNQEWAVVQRQKVTQKPARGFALRPVWGWAALAAALLVVFAVVLYPSLSQSSSAGLAAGQSTPEVLIVGLVLLLVLGLIVLAASRNRR